MSAKAKKANAQNKKGRVKNRNLKRESVKVLSGAEQKKIKGGGGARAGVDMPL
jgi:hypothetical protein